MLYRADWLARLMTLLMLVTASLSAWPNLTSGDFAWPQASVGADSPPNPLSYQENSAPRGGGCVGYACFGQVANQEVGNIITQEGFGENSNQSLLLHGMIGAIQGFISGGGNDGVAAAGGFGAIAGTEITPILANYLSKNGVDPNSAEGKTLLTLASSVVGGLVGSTTGGSGSALAGSSAAAYSTTYNYLKHDQLPKAESAEEGLKACEDAPGTCSQTTINGYEASIQQAQIQSAENDAQLQSDCSGGASAACLNDITQLGQFLDTSAQDPSYNALYFSPTTGGINTDRILYADYSGLLGPDPTETPVQASQAFASDVAKIVPNEVSAAQDVLSITPEGAAGDAVVVVKDLADGAIEYYVEQNPGTIGSALPDIYTSAEPVGDVFPQLEGINPSGGTKNCTSCANAVYDRLTGTNPNATADNLGLGTELDLDVATLSDPGTPDQVTQYMKSLGSGQTRIVTILQPGAPSHAIDATNVNGTVYFIDGQTGQIVTPSPNYMMQVGYPTFSTPKVPWQP